MTTPRPATPPPAPPAPAAETESSAVPARLWIALVPLMIGTFITTLNNNIVNVPMRDILRDLQVPLSEGVLVVVAFNLTFAVLMPVLGWLGDRLGRRRLFCIALVVLEIGAFGAAFAPSLPVLVAARVLQGAATGATLPCVMALIAELFGPVRRGRALGIWAATNGFGQAVGPPLGGLLAGWLGWRSVFWPVIPLAVVAFAGALRFVPRDSGRQVALDWRGAASLTVGCALIIAAVTAVPESGLGSPLPPTLAGVGVLALVVFWLVTRHAERPFISPRLAREPSYLRSSLSVFAQMFCLGATLLGVPLYLTGAGLTTAVAGLLVFAFPIAMTLLAPVAGLLTESFGPRRVIRTGLVALCVAEIALGWELSRGAGRGADLVIALLVAGTGVALVQSPAATGATRSPAGRAGAGVGLFNLIRFAGSALGAAWVAIVLDAGNSFGLLFWVCAGAAVLGFVATFAGPDQPAPDPSTPTPPTSPPGSGISRPA